jgi:hypothetical protein
MRHAAHRLWHAKHPVFVAGRRSHRERHDPHPAREDERKRVKERKDRLRRILVSCRNSKRCRRVYHAYVAEDGVQTVVQRRKNGALI